MKTVNKTIAIARDTSAVTPRLVASLATVLALFSNPSWGDEPLPVDEQKTRWIHVPPRGDPVDVYLVFENSDGKMVEHPISKFVARSGKRVDEFAADEDDAEEDIKFPGTFLFAGSLLRDNGSGPRQYLADHSGHVISIVTFGDELLCLPGVQGHSNESLMWQVDATELPAVGSKVTLRLRPQVQPVSKTGKALPED